MKPMRDFQEILNDEAAQRQKADDEAKERAMAAFCARMKKRHEGIDDDPDDLEHALAQHLKNLGIPIEGIGK